jgi:hypothetical protein
MKRVSGKFYIGLLLVGCSIVLGVLHVVIFADVKTLLFYLALDIAFVPIQVLLVTLIIERLLNEREKQAMIKKLNMVIGAFFSEVGGALMRHMVTYCVDAADLEQRFAVHSGWKAKDYKIARQFADHYECRLAPEHEQLRELRDFLLARRSFVLGLLQNPNLLEHERFTDLLWAVCHLTEELEARDSLEGLPASDRQHLRTDMQRAYGMLTREWLSYMEHLKASYPYIYSLAIRMNPFKPEASPVVR